VDPNTGQPYAQQDPNMGGQQPYPQVDPNTGQPYMQVDPNTGQPYPQVDPNTGQPYVPVDPNTGQPVQGYGYPQGPPNQPMQPLSGYPGQQAPQPQNADSLSSENLLGERRIAPSSGWRRAVYKATAGNIHPGESQGDLRRKDLIARARTPVAGGHHRVAVMSLKGGVGKTTTTTGLGSMLGSLRGDTVIAVDANPDRGTLSDKVKLETAATVRDLLNSRDRIQRYADVRAFTSQNNARLEVLASDRDPAVSEAFSAEDYAAVAVVLEQYYSICITDCGTGLLHSAMAGVLSLADQLVLVSSPSVDGARSASATLDWLEAHNHGHLVRNGVVVLSMVRNRTRSQVDLDKLQAHFESRCRAVVRIPYDDHLEEGAEVELEQLAPATREAYLNLAAVVGDGFAYQRPQA
jgi:MinD-like ATPase involved in chromosome partitioning or flagellar assembly